MNQILNTSVIKKKKYKYLFKTQLIVSLVILIFLVFYVFKNKFYDYENDDFSKTMYQTMKLKTIYTENYIGESKGESLYFCMISIPKIAIEYAVSAKYDEELLKLSPCKFFGTEIGEIR